MNNKDKKIKSRFGKRRGCSIEYAVLPYAKIIPFNFEQKKEIKCQNVYKY